MVTSCLSRANQDLEVVVKSLLFLVQPPSYYHKFPSAIHGCGKWAYMRQENPRNLSNFEMYLGYGCLLRHHQAQTGLDQCMLRHFCCQAKQTKPVEAFVGIFAGRVQPNCDRRALLGAVMISGTSLFQDLVGGTPLLGMVKRGMGGTWGTPPLDPCDCFFINPLDVHIFVRN